ncbi:MAG: carboxypeptidase regulatory-like domain-containing protein [Bacteroidetes bacterium]|nr:carboxypeptidase regulatory-like domain-containing protein [Bacteroidota bacterium]
MSAAIIFPVRISVFLFIIFIDFAAYTQDLYVESFGNSWPPAGWTIDLQPGNWSQSPTQNAGGQAPEARLSGSPSFFNVTRLVSPAFDLTGQTLVKLSFDYSLQHLNAGYSIGLAARNNNGIWTTLWSTVPLESIPPSQQTVVINYPGFNSPLFQFCFFFQGNSQNISSLSIDNVRLFQPPAHDIKVSSVVNEDIQLPNAVFVPKVLVFNNGQNNETQIPVVCKIYDGNNNIVYNSFQNISQLSAAAYDTVDFQAYTLTQVNDYYRVEAYCGLPADQDVTNDTVNKEIKTLTLVERKYVLTEIATAVWCVQCPASDQAIHDLIYAGKKLAVLEYHSPTGDPFSSAASSDRLNYYNVQGYPTGFFDGLLTYPGNVNAFNEYNNLYNQRITELTPFDIKIFGSHSGNNYSLNVILYRMAPVQHPNLVLRVAVTESAIPFAWFSQTQVNNSVRLMVPNAGGVPVNLMTNTMVNVPLTFTMDPGWVQANCSVIAFLQDTVTKEVLQVEKRSYYELVPLGLTKVRGYVRYNNAAATPLPNVTVKLRLGGGVVATTTTNSSGFYSITGTPPGTYYLSCSSNAPWGGSNSADALQVMKYFVTLETFTDLQKKAADTDVTNYVNTTDALNITRRFVGLIPDFIQKNWVYESPTITIPNSTIVNQNINGLCTGDIDGSFIP